MHTRWSTALGLAGLATALGSSLAQAEDEAIYEVRQPGALGVGVGVTQRAIGLSAKAYLSERSAVQGVVGIRGAGEGYGEVFALSADYLFEAPVIVDDPAVAVAWYAGPGVQLSAGGGTLPNGNDWQQVWVGAGAVLGVSMLVRPTPVDVVLEYRPNIQVTPSVDFVPLSFGGHIRYYFGTGALER